MAWQTKRDTLSAFAEYLVSKRHRTPATFNVQLRIMQHDSGDADAGSTDFRSGYAYQVVLRSYRLVPGQESSARLHLAIMEHFAMEKTQRRCCVVDDESECL